MHIIVSKFGGSSVADAVMFQRVRNIVQNRQHSHYIILSAPGRRNPEDEKITDLLYKAHSLSARGENPDKIIHAICCRFEDIAKSLKLPTTPEIFKALKTDVRFSRDQAVSRGEYYCARLFAEYASLPFVDAAELIYFNESGLLDHERTYAAIRQMAKRLSCAIIPGFYGSTPSGKIRTFDRGGSDITGALVAAALDADIYENWTDVNGLMSVDPALCPDAIHHPCVSYRQMQYLSRAGAEILHPCCLEPVQSRGIPTCLRNTFFPDRPGTYISDRFPGSVPCICIRRKLHLTDLKHLSPESSEIAEALKAERYQSDSSSEYILTETGIINSRPVAMVSIFSLPHELTEEAVHIASPIAWLEDSGCLRLILPPDPDPHMLRQLHRLLIGRPQIFQNSCKE